MNDFLLLIILSFATFYLSYGLVHKEGIFHSAKWLREKTIDKSWSPLYCTFCTMLFAAVPFIFFTSNPLMYWWPMAGIAAFINAVYERMEAWPADANKK